LFPIKTLSLPIADLSKIDRNAQNIGFGGKRLQFVLGILKPKRSSMVVMVLMVDSANTLGVTTGKSSK